ncbi:MAG: hypothetical protein U5L76_01530 [Patescibacteria group bacterium]|nr:hypothetical protein [Patescibacteria group bacterium]
MGKKIKHVPENLLEQATNDTMGVSKDNRGYWKGTNTDTGKTATGKSAEEISDKLDD